MLLWIKYAHTIISESSLISCKLLDKVKNTNLNTLSFNACFHYRHHLCCTAQAESAGTNDLPSVTWQGFQGWQQHWPGPGAVPGRHGQLCKVFCTSRDVHQKPPPPLSPECSKVPSELKIYSRPSECPQLSRGHWSRALCPHQEASSQQLWQMSWKSLQPLYRMG